jgi:hypothetical protein
MASGRTIGIDAAEDFTDTEAFWVTSSGTPFTRHKETVT